LDRYPHSDDPPDPIFRAEDAGNMFLGNICASLQDYGVSYSGRGKAVPLQAWTGPEGTRRLKLPDFKTTGT